MKSINMSAFPMNNGKHTEPAKSLPAASGDDPIALNNKNQNPPSTPQLVPASQLVRPATPAQAQQQKRWMIGLGLVYALVVGVTVLCLVNLWMGRNAGLGASLGQVMGYAFGTVLFWFVERTSGFRLGSRPRIKQPVEQQQQQQQQQEPAGENETAGSRTNNDTATPSEEGPIVAVVDEVKASPGTPMALNGDPPPQSFYCMASLKESRQQNRLLLKYGTVLFPLGIAPLLGLVSWQSSFRTAGIGCMIGYVAGCLYYPVIITVVSGITGKYLLWMHCRKVHLADAASGKQPSSSHV